MRMGHPVLLYMELRNERDKRESEIVSRAGLEAWYPRLMVHNIGAYRVQLRNSGYRYSWMVRKAVSKKASRFQGAPGIETKVSRNLVGKWCLSGATIFRSP